MTIEWWNTRTKGIYIFMLSPFRQRAMFDLAESYKRYFMSFIRPRTLIPLSIIGTGVLTIKWANYKYYQLNRKNRNEIENEYQANLEKSKEIKTDVN